MLHNCFVKSSETGVHEVEETNDQIPVHKIGAYFSPDSNEVTVLPTAQVQVASSNGKQSKLRALIDTGSHVNAITEDACKLLGLKIQPCETKIVGVNQKKPTPVSGLSEGWPDSSS